MKNVQVTLLHRPKGKPQASDFEVVESETPELAPSQALVKNLYVSMDAGFRNWMDEDSGDDVLPAMPLDQPVMGLILGEIVESKNPAINVGRHIMARLAWEQYSVVDESDWLVTTGNEGCQLTFGDEPSSGTTFSTVPDFTALPPVGTRPRILARLAAKFKQGCFYF